MIYLKEREYNPLRVGGGGYSTNFGRGGYKYVQLGTRNNYPMTSLSAILCSSRTSAYLSYERLLTPAEIPVMLMTTIL